MERNFSNSERHGYNCGGFALGIFNWYRPYSSRKFCDLEDLIDAVNECLDAATDMCIEHMIEELGGRLRVIESAEDLREGEVLVLFRCGLTDFHYVLHLHNQYLHKIGNRTIIDLMDEDEVFGPYWEGIGHTYDGPLVMLALTADAELWDGLLDEVAA